MHAHCIEMVKWYYMIIIIIEIAGCFICFCMVCGCVCVMECAQISRAILAPRVPHAREKIQINLIKEVVADGRHTAAMDDDDDGDSWCSFPHKYFVCIVVVLSLLMI